MKKLFSNFLDKSEKSLHNTLPVAARWHSSEKENKNKFSKTLDKTNLSLIILKLVSSKEQRNVL